MTGKRFRTGKGVFEGDYFSETIINTKTGEKYYGGIKPNYVSSKEICELLNEQDEIIGILTEFLELNDFDVDEIIRQGKGLE